MPCRSRASRKRMTSAPTTVTSSRSRAARGPQRSSCSEISPRCSAFAAPIIRTIHRPPSPLRSSLNVIHHLPPSVAGGAIREPTLAEGAWGLARRRLSNCSACARRIERRPWVIEMKHAGCSTTFPGSPGAGCPTARRTSSTIAGTSTPAFLPSRRTVRAGRSLSIPTTCRRWRRSGWRSSPQASRARSKRGCGDSTGATAASFAALRQCGTSRAASSPGSVPTPTSKIARTRKTRRSASSTRFPRRSSFSIRRGRPSARIAHRSSTTASPEQVAGTDARKLIFHADDVERLKEERALALARGVPFSLEWRARRHDGQYRWYLIHYNPLRDEQGRVLRWYASGTDIEDRRRAEDKLRQEEQELRQLIDFLPEHVVVLDKEGRLLHANKTMLDYSGYTLEEMKGGGDAARIKRDVHPDDLDRVHSERAAGLSKAVPFEMEKRLLNKNGQFRWFLFRYRPVFDRDGSVVRWFASATDIEERKQAEARVRNEAVALREDIVRASMFEEIVGSSAALRAILAQVSRVAPTDSTVLIRGETGTGKE